MCRKGIRNYLVSVAVLSAVLVGCSQLIAAPEPDDNQNPRTYFISMSDRVQQLVGIIKKPSSCQAAAAAIRHGMEVLYGGLRPLPTPGEIQPKTIRADHVISKSEKKFANALNDFIEKDNCPDQAAAALDLKLLVEQINEVALAVGRETINCPQGKPCPGLVPFLDEQTGHEIVGDPKKVVRVPFSLKLRSPFIPTNFTFDWDEHVVSTKPIPPGSCVAVFKETRGTDAQAAVGSYGCRA